MDNVLTDLAKIYGSLEKLPQDLDEKESSFTIPENYEIIVECRDAADQKRIFEKLKLEGYKLRILTL